MSMSVKTYTSDDAKHLSIIVEDRFDFSQHQNFRDAYSSHTNSGTLFTVDLSQTEYMDSSALGMILLLKDHAENINGQIEICKPNEVITKILEIAQFHRLMKIER